MWTVVNDDFRIHTISHSPMRMFQRMIVHFSARSISKLVQRNAYTILYMILL